MIALGMAFMRADTGILPTAYAKHECETTNRLWLCAVFVLGRFDYKYAKKSAQLCGINVQFDAGKTPYDDENNRYMKIGSPIDRFVKLNHGIHYP